MKLKTGLTSGPSTNDVTHIEFVSGKVNASESLNSVMGEELQLKIEENAKLHATLSDIDKRHEEKCDVMHSR